MTLDAAITSPVESMTPQDIWQAINLIGIRKLAMRRSTAYTRILDQLAPLNKRLDALQKEDERRRFRQR